MANNNSDNPRLRDRAGGRLLAGYIRLVHATSRVVTEPADINARLTELHPLIVAMWHGQFMMLPKLKPADIPVRIMVARHGDAEGLGLALRRFDMDLIRGAGAGDRRRDRGGAQALRNAVRALEQGATVAMTADVPPGPARRAGAGIITLARLSGRPIMAAAMATSRYHAFDTWSRMTLNLPFSTLGVTVGEPIFVPREADEATLEALRSEVENSLNAATARAYALAHADITRALPPAMRHWQNGATMPPAAAGSPANAGSTLRGATTIDGSASAADLAPTPGVALNLYRTATHLLRPTATFVLGYRERHGKEIAARRPERFGLSNIPRPPGPLFWFHAASVGETATILPVMKQLSAARPEAQLLLTTGTVTSASLAAQRLPKNAVHQFVPLDSPPYVRNFLDHWRPDLGVFMESEIWPNLILESTARRIPLALVNARMSKHSFRRWRSRPGIAGPLFGRFEVILAQDARLASQFTELGAHKALAVGNLKIDAPPPPVDAALLAALRAATAGRPLWLAASTHEGEEVLIGEAHRQLAKDFPGLLTIIAPRHPERGGAIAGQLRGLGFGLAQRSTGQLPDAGTEIYLADSLGELGTLFALAPVSFIGKSLAVRGGHNPIEAVYHGSAVVSGIHRQNFREAYDALARAHGAVEVRSDSELANAVSMLLKDAMLRTRQTVQATKAMGELSGALARTTSELLALLPAATAPPISELQRAS